MSKARLISSISILVVILILAGGLAIRTFRHKVAVPAIQPAVATNAKPAPTPRPEQVVDLNSKGVTGPISIHKPAPQYTKEAKDAKVQGTMVLKSVIDAPGNVSELPANQAAGEQPLGRVLYSHAASLRGVSIPGPETIVTGDVLTTSAEGSALVELKRGTRVKIEGNSSVRFLQDGEAVRAELLSGAVVSESVGKSTLIVSTPKYQFAPAQEGECRYRVQLSREQATVAAAMQGNVIVEARDGSGSHVLQEGTYATISPSAAGVPDQVTAAGVQLGAQHVGTVSDVIPDGVVQRQGQGAESPLKVNDGIDWGDVVRTLQIGRLRIALSDGSFLNIGSRSIIKIIRRDPKTQQTQIQLTSGTMRAWVVKQTLPGMSFEVQTPDAVTGVAESDFIVEAQVDVTRVYCIEGMVSVRNIDAAVAGEVILHAGEFTVVDAGKPPSAPERASETLLQSQIDQTTVTPSPAGGRRTRAAAGWHIGSLSEAESVGLLVGVGAGAAAGIAVPLTTSGKVSPSSP